jgi:hypothetical protein
MEAYPNPQREGCPEVSKLRAIAYRDRRYPSAELPISHVATCSPCFKQYLGFRRRLFVTRTAQVAAACVGLFAAVFGGSRFVQNRIVQHVAPNVAQSAPNRPGTPQPQNNPLVPIRVDLAAYSPVRGDAANTAPPKIHLPAKSLRITFLLPVGMEPTQYLVRILDSAGKAVVEKSVSARLAGGVASFEIDLNLDKAVSGPEWSLLLREPGLSWRTYPIMID